MGDESNQGPPAVEGLWRGPERKDFRCIRPHPGCGNQNKERGLSKKGGVCVCGGN